MTASRFARVLFAAAIGAGSVQVRAQQPKPATSITPRSAAAIDLTGYWVSYVTEDWRFRMITPPKGDYRAVPLTAEGRKTADAWDPAADARTGNECKAYGAAAIMRVPGRFHISWQDDNTLRVEADTGRQTRLFRFGPAPASTARTWQGSSTATWDRLGRSLTVVTTNMRAGYLRRNGVPYSEDASSTEYFDLAPHPGGGQMLIVTTVVEDPRYLQRSFVVSSQFKKEPDGSKWNPTPCTATW
jgi:hypothetical protein